MPGESLTEKPLNERVEAAEPLIPVSKSRRIGACVAALILPGLGHIVLGRAARGALIGLGIASMFILGFLMEGHLFTPVRGEWLTWFFTFLDTGVGLPYLICLILDLGFKVEPEQAARITFEYGNTFLMVAGALNMLATLDAYDIAVGRKP